MWCKEVSIPQQDREGPAGSVRFQTLFLSRHHLLGEAPADSSRLANLLCAAGFSSSSAPTPAAPPSPTTFPPPAAAAAGSCGRAERGSPAVPPLLQRASPGVQAAFPHESLAPACCRFVSTPLPSPSFAPELRQRCACNAACAFAVILGTAAAPL